MDVPSRRRLPALLAAAGLILSGMLEVLHVRAYLYPAASSFCSVSENLDCDVVALSRFSVVAGIPLPVWGIVFFALVLYAIIRRRELLLPLALGGAVGSVLMLVEELVNVGSVCLLCEAVHVVAIGLAIVAWRDRDIAATVAYAKDWRSTLNDLAPALGVLAAVWLFAPPYWMLVSWGSGVRLEQGVDDQGRPWIGAADPTIVVHEYVDYGCPHCKVATMQTRLRVGAHPSEIRVVRHHQPRMKCTPIQPGSTRCLYVRVALCAGDQGKFWEMDDWLFRHAPGQLKIDIEDAARDVGIDAAALSTCVEAPATSERAQVDVEEAKTRKIRLTPAYVIDDEVYKPAEAAQAIEDRV